MVMKERRFNVNSRKCKHCHRAVYAFGVCIEHWEEYRRAVLYYSKNPDKMPKSGNIDLSKSLPI